MLTMDVMWMEGSGKGVRLLIPNSLLLVWSLYGSNPALSYLVHSSHLKALCSKLYLLVTSRESVFIVAFHLDQK